MSKEEFNSHSIDSVLSEIRSDVKTIKEVLPIVFKRLDKQDEKIEALEAWKNKALGIYGATTFILGGAIGIAIEFYRK